ncbi:MAG TPA: hypothetical protein VF505_13830 [Thermoanaerobaculia bacterium]
MMILSSGALLADCTWVGTTPPFLTTVNCSVGVNTTTPAFPLEIVKDGANVQLTGSAFSVAGGAVNFLGRGARGTVAAPQATQANDFLMVMGGRGHTGSAFSSQNSSRIAFRAGSSFSPTSQGGFITFDTVDGADAGLVLTPRMTIGMNGNVGIGVAPAANVRLSVTGDVNVTGSITGTSVINAVYGQDVAEWVGTSQSNGAGTVMVLDRTRNNEVVASMHAYDTAVAGVLSDHAGIVLGKNAPNKVQVATTGRVPVRVDATKHPIRIGDLLVTSDKPGIAMYSEPVEFSGIKMHRPGTIVGKALEPLEKGEGTVLVLLSLQ